MIGDDLLSMDTIIMPKYMTTKEVAARLEIDHSKVRRAIAHGWLTHTKMGHTNLVTEADLRKWEATNYRVYPNKKRKGNE